VTDPEPSNQALTTPAHCQFKAPDADSLCRQFMAVVSSKGKRRLYANDAIHEVWGLSGVLQNPRARLFKSSSHPQLFRPGLAVARWFFMFSGSNRLADIVAYSPGAARFTDDGVTMPGGSHGARVFSPVSGVDQVERAIATIADLGETTRAVLAIHHPTDLAQFTTDYVCGTSMLMTVREGHLHCMLHMRSNEALRLLWYDLFEFTMLGEYVAVRLGLKLGTYLHSGFVFQITGDHDKSVAADVAQEVELSQHMPAMPQMTQSDRVVVVNLERQVREASRYATRKGFLDLVRGLASQTDPYWVDLLGAAALQCRFIVTDVNRYPQLLNDIRAVAAGPLTALCLQYSEGLISR
jgi:thymidylate synthase